MNTTATAIICRSPSEIREDALIEAHDMVRRALNTVIAGRCAYTGAARQKLAAAKAAIEQAMDNESVDYHAITRTAMAAL